MIELKVENYCHSCPQFSPVADIKRVYPVGEDEPMMMTTTVECEHAKLCRNITKHIKTQLQEEG